MKANHRVPVLTVSLLTGCLLASPARAQLWDIDLNTSTIQINTSGFADDIGTPGFVDDIDNAMALGPNFVAPAGTFDFGNAVTSIAHDGMVTSSANAFVTADGQLSNALQVRWSANTLNDSELPNDGFFAVATADAGTQITATLTGLNPGQNYLMRVDYHYEGQAVTDHEAAFEDLEESSGSLDFTLDGTSQSVFSEVLDSDRAPLLPGLVDVTDSVLVPFQAGGTTADLVVDFAAAAFAQLNPPNLDDLSGSFFFGEATFTIIPEPATLGLTAVGLGLMIRRRH